MSHRSASSAWIVAGPLIAAIIGTSMSRCACRRRLANANTPAQTDAGTVDPASPVPNSSLSMNESPEPVRMITLFSGSRPMSSNMKPHSSSGPKPQTRSEPSVCIVTWRMPSRRSKLKYWYFSWYSLSCRVRPMVCLSLSEVGSGYAAGAG